MSRALRILAVDVGTSWTKLDTFSWDPPQLTQIDSTRIARQPLTFNEWATQVIRIIKIKTDDYHPDFIGFTGFREFVVVVDEAGIPMMTSDSLVGLPYEERRYLNGTALSGQGYLVFMLTGNMAITASERDALTYAYPEQVKEVWHLPDEFAIAAEIGKYHSVPVFLSGTDEQAAHYSSGLAYGTDLAIAAASFWSFSCPYVGEPPAEPIRLTPAVLPYPGAASLIGYRWGIYLREIYDGGKPFVSDRLPGWAFGTFLANLCKGGVIGYQRALSMIAEDVRMAREMLSSLTPVYPHRVVVHGGGIKRLPGIVSMLHETLGGTINILPYDASLLGTVMVAAPDVVGAIHPNL